MTIIYTNHESKYCPGWQNGTIGGIALFVLVALFGMTQARAQAPTAETTNGEIIGLQVAGTSPAINAFLGVPFAAPPIGDLRFAPPQPHASWQTPLQTTQSSQPCLQAPNGAPLGSEDCLYLNVYTPAKRSLVPRPVLVFIPGGGFVEGTGNSPYYDGQVIAEQSGEIVVTINYRLAALGFLTAPSLDAESPHGVSGNYGLEDQQAALRWIKANAAAFGGNANNITLFGESAGANSTEYQLASPLAAGLFQHAIVESAIGPPLIPSQTLAQSEAGGSLGIISKVGCSGASNVPACLRAAPADSFLSAGFLTGLLPVIDGYILKQTPLAAFQSGQFNKVQVITGSNLNEATNLVELVFPQVVNPPLTASGYTEILEQEFGSNAEAVQAQYPVGDYQSPIQAFAAVATDAFVACPTEQKRIALAEHTAVYGYEFSDPNPVMGPLGPYLLPPTPGLTYGAYHTADLPYVFGLASPGGTPLTGKDLTLSRSVISYWSNFGLTGSPSSVPYGWDPIWSNYRQGELLNINDTITPLPVGTFDKEHDCSFWSTVDL
jgi:para-nitrobenzyl esterase